jgi:hypothetical protein
MTKLRIGSLAGAAVLAALMTAGSGLAANSQDDNQHGKKSVRCENQALGPVTIDGNIVVPSGAFCDLNGTHVTGNATVESGPPEPSNPTGLTSNAATIDGNVLVQRNAQFAAFTGSNIGGNVRCNQCEVADIQGSTVEGSLEDNGVSEGAFIRNSHFGGNLRIQDGTDFFNTHFAIDGNTIGDSLVFNRNTGVSDISTNTVDASLTCRDNTPPPTGAGNTAEHKRGQCAAL